MLRFLFSSSFKLGVGVGRRLREEIDHSIPFTQAKNLRRLTVSQIPMIPFVQGKENILLKDDRKGKLKSSCFGGVSFLEV